MARLLFGQGIRDAPYNSLQFLCCLQGDAFAIEMAQITLNFLCGMIYKGIGQSQREQMPEQIIFLKEFGYGGSKATWQRIFFNGNDKLDLLGPGKNQDFIQRFRKA